MTLTETLCPSVATPPPKALRVLGAAALLFGALTVFSGARALFGPDEARAALGQVIAWVLWFNFVAGFAYAAVGWGLWRGSARWAGVGAVLIAAATALVAVALALHMAAGGAYELRTVAAMALRLLFWSALAGCAWRFGVLRKQ